MTGLHKISQEPHQNSGRHVGDMTVPYLGPINITHHGTQFSGMGDKVPRICAPLIYDINSQNGWQCTHLSSPPLTDLPISLYASHAIKSREDQQWIQICTYSRAATLTTLIQVGARLCESYAFSECRVFKAHLVFNFGANLILRSNSSRIHNTVGSRPKQMALRMSVPCCPL
jgi:hypothetical protein